MLELQNFFIVGIKGVAMVNVARILKQMGKNVSGSDVEGEFITDQVLIESRIPVLHNFEPDQLPLNTQVVVYAAAHQGLNNSQVKEALKRGIKVVHQIDILQEILAEYKTSVAVCGCHGKTTTSAMLAHALVHLKASPGYMVGVSQFGANYGGELGKKNYFVLEADEYGMNPPRDRTPKLSRLHTTHAICTNIDFDHPDVYENLEETKQVFGDFFARVLAQKNPHSTSSLCICADDLPSLEVISQLDRSKYVTFGFSQQADYQIIHLASTEDHTSFRLIHQKKSYPFQLSIYGEKNVSNAAGVIAFLMEQGFEPNAIQEAIKDFSGAKRRFEQKWYLPITNQYLFDDYAHHPHEIAATISAAKLRFPHRRIIILFQPHTFSRTEKLKHEFVQALSQADRTLILPIFGSARERISSYSITAQDLERLARSKGITSIVGYLTTKSLLSDLKSFLQPGDVIFTMGAGDVYHLSSKIKKICEMSTR